MNKPSYKQAIEWLAVNDDCYWIGDFDAHGPMLSVSASLVRDLWSVTDEKLIRDLKKQLALIHPNHKALS